MTVNNLDYIMTISVNTFLEEIYAEIFDASPANRVEKSVTQVSGTQVIELFELNTSTHPVGGVCVCV